MNKLQGKVAVVTGASKGIGAAIAKSFAAEGAKVVVNYASSKSGADAVVKGIASNGGTAIAVQADVAKSDDVSKLFEEAKSAFGSVDVLVNNAGVYQFATIEEFTEELFNRQFNTNVLGSLLTIQAAVKQFGNKGGSIINISSVVSKLPMPASSVYSATKAALDAITVSLSKEFKGRNIRINSILPGSVETEGTHTAGITGSELEAQLIANTPLGRMGQPQDIAKAAVFLASDDAAWIHGEKIAASGGIFGF